MSYDVALYLQVDTGGPEPIDYCAADIGNYTSNVSRMWDEALGHRLADLHGQNAGDSADVLKQAVADMEARPDHYRAMNPANGWGDYEGALDYLRRLMIACCAHPKAEICISH
ncbi:hypothetical protein [Streptomyces anthocyanicus]|uniref:hypothetical protein n=1 Tax=Streptomyces anthocyanicus TaxID=68174 RepID=UPI0038689272|nr:hypothetical protein OH747_05575 [Streptomyces anthocyanicus]